MNYFPSTEEGSNNNAPHGIHMVRLMTFLPGEILITIPYTPDILYQVGRFAGAMDKYLMVFLLVSVCHIVLNNVQYYICRRSYILSWIITKWMKEIQHAVYLFLYSWGPGMWTRFWDIPGLSCLCLICTRSSVLGRPKWSRPQEVVSWWPNCLIMGSKVKAQKWSKWNWQQAQSTASFKFNV